MRSPPSTPSAACWSIAVLGFGRRRSSTTANSAVAAVDRLKERGANDIRLACLIGVPEGIERMRGVHPDVPIWLAAIDQGLDENAYILPGLGDAGDRAYGTK